MIKLKLFLIPVALILVFNTFSQNIDAEVGFGIGRGFSKNLKEVKGELYINILKDFNFGKLGLEISRGGNLNPYSDNSSSEETNEIVSPIDFSYVTLDLLYRIPVKKSIFLETRIGYGNLFAYVNTDNERSIHKNNLSFGLGVVGNIKRLTISAKYQYLGKTPDYDGSNNMRGPLSVLQFKFSYRFSLFKKKVKK